MSCCWCLTHVIRKTEGSTIVYFTSVNNATENAPGHVRITCLEQIYPTTRNHSVRPFEPGSNRLPAVTGVLEEIGAIIPCSCLCVGELAACPKLQIHVSGIRRKIAWDHVNQPRASITRLEDSRIVCSLVSNLSKRSYFHISIVAIAHFGEHLIQTVHPFL